MIVRIFLPDTLYALKSIDLSKCYLIFGKIDSNCDKNVSIFIVDIKETGQNGGSSQQQQAIGCILPGNEIDNSQWLDGDFIEFTSKSDENPKLQFNHLHLPTFIPAGQSFHTQMFLYNLKVFTDLAQRIDETVWSHRPDAIAQLLILIKNNEEQKYMANRIGPTKSNLSDSSQRRSSSDQNRWLTFLMIVSVFVQSKLSFLNSAFVRHLQFWTSNLTKLTQNR